MMKFTNLHSSSFITSTSQYVKLMGLIATLLFILFGASSYLRHGYNYYSTAGSPNSNHLSSHVTPKRPSTSAAAGDPPVLAYWIYGSNGDSSKMLRLLKSTYHPRNQYLLLLMDDTSNERTDLALSVQSDPLFAYFDNVNVVGRTYAVNQMGVSGLAALLHASALLLKITSTTWDWFIPLSAAYDYPLFTQDDILHAFTLLPRDLNFVHFSNTTSSHDQLDNDLVKRVTVDPSLYNKKTSPVYYAKETRNAPNTFKILGGSPWVILSRSLVEFCVKGWNNFPRKLIMYMTNLEYPLDFYFQTIICNSPGFHNTTIDNDLRHVMSKNESLITKMEDMSVFARWPFKNEDHEALLLMQEEIDNNILNHSANGVVPGKWCMELKTNATTNNGDLIKTKGINYGWRWGDIDSVEASTQGAKLRQRLSKLASERTMRFEGCPSPSTMLKRL